ncbi:MAG: hypothetical protein ACW99U_20070 [Candidatus Thorarchaeota archaeon]
MSRFLSGNEDLCRMALESLDDALHVVDRDMVIQYGNPALDKWMKTMGLEADPVGKKFSDCFLA